MLFNSLTFVVFFLVVLAAYWTMRSWEARKNLLLVASYIFYGAWNPPFAALLFATALPGAQAQLTPADAGTQGTASPSPGRIGMTASRPRWPPCT